MRLLFVLYFSIFVIENLKILKRMKKIYLSLLSIGFAFTVNAQLNLTKAFNEPVLGDVNTKNGYDSVGVVPKNTGASQTWNFSTLTTNTIVDVSTFTTVSSTPNGTAFPTSTLAEGDGTGAFNYWKSTSTTYELMGFDDGAGSTVTFTNSAIAAVWPVNMGYSNTDAYGGPVMVTSLSGFSNGNITTNGTGTGTVILPGSLTFTNCLQVKMTNSLNIQVGTFPSSYTLDVQSTEYDYYSGTQKFPLITVHYETQTATSAFGPTVQVTADIRINNNVLTGINNLNFDALNYNVYPNPATDAVNIDLTNNRSENVSVIVMNNLGQVVKSAELGNVTEVKYFMSTADLRSGIYYVKTSIGERSSTKKLIIQ
jgi:hypothetical protein